MKIVCEQLGRNHFHDRVFADYNVPSCLTWKNIHMATYISIIIYIVVRDHTVMYVYITGWRPCITPVRV